MGRQCNDGDVQRALILAAQVEKRCGTVVSVSGPPLIDDPKALVREILSIVFLMKDADGRAKEQGLFVVA